MYVISILNWAFHSTMRVSIFHYDKHILRNPTILNINKGCAMFPITVLIIFKR